MEEVATLMQVSHSCDVTGPVPVVTFIVPAVALWLVMAEDVHVGVID